MKNETDMIGVGLPIKRQTVKPDPDDPYYKEKMKAYNITMKTLSKKSKSQSRFDIIAGEDVEEIEKLKKTYEQEGNSAMVTACIRSIKRIFGLL